MDGDAAGMDVGSVVGTPGRTPPFVLLDPVGAEVQPVVRYLSSLSLSDCSDHTVRAYAYGLLRWYRVLWQLQVPWDRATRSEADALVGYLRNGVNPQRARRRGGIAPGSVNLRTGKASLGTGYSASGINHTLSVVRGFYVFHAESGSGPVLNPIPGNPAAAQARRHRSPLMPAPVFRRGSLRQRVPRLLPRAMSDAQWDDFFETMRTDRDRALVLMYVSTAARASELLGVTVADVDWGGQRIYVLSKGTRVRQPVPASPEAFRALASYLEQLPVLQPHDSVWRSLRGESRPMTYSSMRRVIQRANDRLGTNWTAHDLRHTAAMRMANDPNVPIVHTQAVLRHAHLSTTNTYLRADQEEVFARVQEHFERPRPVPKLTADYDPEDMRVVFGD